MSYHPTQKPLRLVRRALLASQGEGDLVFDPFADSGTMAVGVKELNHACVGAELEEEFTKLAERRIATTWRGSVLRKISEQFRNGTEELSYSSLSKACGSRRSCKERRSSAPRPNLSAGVERIPYATPMLVGAR